MAVYSPWDALISWGGSKALQGISALNPELGGSLGKAVDTVGQWAGNPFPDYGGSENAEKAGGQALALSQGQSVADQKMLERENVGGNSYNVPTKTESVIINSNNSGVDRNNAASIKNAMPGYNGWSDAAIIADYAATGGSGKGGSTGSPSGGSQKTVTKNGSRITVEDKGDQNNAVDDSGNPYYDTSVPSLDEQANWIFQDLDKQVASYDDYKKGMKTELDSNAVDQKLAAEEAKTSNVGALTDSANKEIDRSTGTLRDLTTNANDLLQRLVQMYGGGSSAEAAMTGMGRTINQQRGGVLSARDTALRDIENKKIAVNSTYTKQTQAIDKWVDDNMIKIGNQIQGWIGDIANAKASVRAQLSAKAVDSARNYLTQLALSKESYKQNLDAWKLQRTADLEDYKTKLGLQAQYNPQTYQYDLNPNKTSSTGNGATNWWNTNSDTTASNSDYSGSTGGSGSLIDTSSLIGLGNSTKKDLYGNTVTV